MTIIIKVVAISLLPIFEDEAYYAYWAKNPAWGYFDHPPMVAWLGSLVNIVPTAFGFRFIGLVLCAFGLWMFGRLCEESLRRADSSAVRRVFCLFAFSAGGLILGVLLTPDVGMAVAWIAGLHEAAVAIKRDPRRWLSAGLIVGLGLLSKYTMILILPVLFFGMIFSKRKQGGWPYLGVVVAFLVFVPHIIWNTQNDWVSFRFQLQRGLKNSHLSINTESTPLSHSTAVADSFESRVSDYFLDAALEPKVRKARSFLQNAQKNIVDYAGSLLLLWGFLLLLLPMLWGIWNKAILSSIHPELRPLILLATVVPILFFLAIACFTKVEANWAAIYLPSAAILLGESLSKSKRLMLWCAVANICALIALSIHASLPPGAPRLPIARIERETGGFRELADTIKQILEETPSFVLFDSYQTGSMLMHYQPKLHAWQLPAMTRDSEFTRSQEWSTFTGEQNILVVQYQRQARSIPGYRLIEAEELRLCERGLLSRWTYQPGLSYANICAEQTLRRWFLLQYQKEVLP
jgi:4-amino-4-deoxy-L-arabinose transferase-like glycosyltransferase